MKRFKLFAEAEKFVGDQLNFSIDHARIIGVVGVERKDDTLLKDAFHRFASIQQKAPENSRNLRNWAVTLFGLGKYSEAWEKVKLAEATPDGGHLDPEFLKSLESRMPRPN